VFTQFDDMQDLIFRTHTIFRMLLLSVIKS
jgi:hypothetical protein